MRRLLRRLSYLLHRRQLDRDLADELETHREMMSEDRRPAFGSALRLREDSRDAWGWVWLDRLRQDLAYAFRILWRSPGFTLTAITVLALGEGVNLAGINLIDAALYHRITVRDASSLLRLRRLTPSGMEGMFAPRAADFYRTHSNAFSYLVTETTSTNFFTGEDSAPQSGRSVSGNYFAALGVTPAYGRLLEERDAQPGAPPVVVLAYGYWQQFGSDPNVIGKVLRLNGESATVVGIAPSDFKGLSPEETAFWIPANTSGALDLLFGKLKPGVTLASAQAELASMVPVLRQQDPSSAEPAEILRGEFILGIPRKQFPAFGAVMIALVVMVLLAACANLGNILLARGLARTQEIRTRMAMGAGRVRVIRQLVTENLVLAILGGGLGLWVGHYLARLLLYLTDAPSDVRIVTDVRVMAAAGILTMIAAVAFGLLPALKSTRPAHKTTRTRQILVAVQVAVSCVLLILSSLLIRSVQRTFALDLRFDYKHMAWLYPQSTGADLSPSEAAAEIEELSARVARLPGADQVTSAGIMPLSNSLRLISVPNSPPVSLNDVAPSYFQVMNLPLVRGRAFRTGELDAVMVSESAARAVWGATNPVGQVWDLSQGAIAASTYRGKAQVPLGPTTVVGVVKDSGANLVAAPDSVEAYVVRGSILPTYQTLIVHGTGDPAILAGQITRAAMLPGVRLFSGTMRERLQNHEDTLRSFAAILGLMGGTAVLLAAIGIFGLLSFTVAQRTREIGIRMALGARTVSVLWLLARQYSVALAVGMACGIAISAAATQLMRGESEFYQLSMRDPAGYLGGLVAFAVVALAAALAPALRALRINPATALRWE